MSARYVWNVYDKSKEFQDKITSTAVTQVDNIPISKAATTEYPLAIASTSYTFDKSTGTYSPAGTTVYLREPAGSVGATESMAAYPFLMRYSGTLKSSDIYYNSQNTLGLDWYVRTTSQSGNIAYISIRTNPLNYAFGIRSAVEVEIQGSTSKGIVCGSSQTSYPANGAGTTTSTSSNWYVYQGSDSIDPTTVSCSTSEPRGGEEITVTVAPSTSKQYGGTIYYQYSYSTNGGASWTASGSKTTDTSKKITISAGATQFQVRVQASDDMGFTSTDYVTGANLDVTSMLAYIGVAGKARRVDKIYIGVNGKAREVAAGYIGVNGKARKFL